MFSLTCIRCTKLQKRNSKVLQVFVTVFQAKIKPSEIQFVRNFAYLKFVWSHQKLDKLGFCVVLPVNDLVKLEPWPIRVQVLVQDNLSLNSKTVLIRFIMAICPQLKRFPFQPPVTLYNLES